MSAFNRRLQPKEIGGMPLYAVLGLLGALIFGVVSLLLPTFFLLITLPLFLGCLGIAVASFWIGDELPFLPVMLASRRERHATTREVWSEQ